MTLRSQISTLFPYTTLFRSFAADEDGVIDLVVQAANFTDIRSSGIIRSIKFGSQPAVNEETTFSISMQVLDRKSTRLNSSHVAISYAVFCLKKKKHHSNRRS